MRLKSFADYISVTEAFARTQKIPKTEPLLTIFLKKAFI